jgi:tetratricopeptide (TPR) repeat protein
MPNLSSGTESQGPSLLHQAFLERASDTSAPGSGDLALGAFLTLRLVDQFGAKAKPNRAALSYQVRATWDFVQNLPGDSPELSHLRQIARVGEQVLKRRDARLLWSPMLAYAYWLEQELRLAESLDVLDTALGLATAPETEEQVAAHLQRGRVYRIAGDYERATESYEAGAEIAARLGDHHSVRASRIGRAVVLSRLGNLPASEAILRETATDAEAAGDREAAAHAYHDLANTLELMGRENEGILAVFRAYELYEQRNKQMAALQVVGLLMKAIGNYKAADNAFSVVMDSHPNAELALNTRLELLHLASLTGDRVAFERWRRDLEGQRSSMPADAFVDFATKLGQGYAAFGQITPARAALESAVRRAEQHKLNKYLFRAEQALRALDTMEQQQRHDTPRVSGAYRAEVDEVAEKLELLRASA